MSPETVLRKLNILRVNKIILGMFYYSFIESVIAFSITFRFSSASFRNRTAGKKGKVCSKITGLPLRTVSCLQTPSTQASRPDNTGPLMLSSHSLSGFHQAASNAAKSCTPPELLASLTHPAPRPPTATPTHTHPRPYTHTSLTPSHTTSLLVMLNTDFNLFPLVLN